MKRTSEAKQSRSMFLRLKGPCLRTQPGGWRGADREPSHLLFSKRETETECRQMEGHNEAEGVLLAACSRSLRGKEVVQAG